MKNLNSKAVLASILFAGLTLVSCKDKNSEAEGDTTGTETGTGYDETPSTGGENGIDAMGSGTDGSTGTMNDTTTVDGNNTGNGSTGTGSGGNGTGTGTGSGTGTTTRP